MWREEIQQKFPSFFHMLFDGQSADLFTGQNRHQTGLIPQIFIHHSPQNIFKVIDGQQFQPLHTFGQQSLMGIIGFEFDQCFNIFSAYILIVELLKILHEDVEYLHSLGGFQEAGCSFVTFYWITNVGNNVVRQVRFRVFLAFHDLLSAFGAAGLGRGRFGLLFFKGASLEDWILLELTILLLYFRVFC